MQDFKGKTAVITGAASGIGKSLALRLASMGCNLAISDINVKSLKATAGGAAEEGVKVNQTELDVSNRANFEEYATSIGKEFDQINILINNAGFGIAGSIKGMSIEDYAASIDKRDHSEAKAANAQCMMNGRS